MSTPSVWTPERNEQLRALYKLPINQEEIARRLSQTGYTFSLMSINAQIQKLGLHRTPALTAQMKKLAGGSKTASSGWTAERTDELEKLVALGLSGSQIAEKMGLSRNQVVGRSHRCGFKLSGGAAQEARVLSNVAIRPKKRKPAPTLKLVEGVMKPPKPMPKPYNGPSIPFHQASRFQCHYAMDDPMIPGTADTPVCGAPCDHTGWCSKHLSVIWEERPPRRDRDRPMNATWRASK